MMLRKSAMLAAASAVALMTAPALSAGDKSAEDPRAGAQTESQTQMQGGAQTQGDAQMQGTARTQSETKIRADDLLDKNIQNAQGESIGDIDSVLINENGEVAAVIVAVGGFLGMGERNVAIDWNVLEIREDGGTIQSSMTRDQLESLPEYDYERTEQRGTAFIDRTYRDRQAVRDPQAARERTENEMAADTAGRVGQAGQAENWTDADRYRISKLIGANVVNENGEQIGEVEDVIVMDDRTHLVLGVGEFLGMGGRSVTLELDQAQLQHRQDNRDELRVSLSMSKDVLKSLPEYNPDQREAGQGSRN
jgi:sporulation protein YlmC with PRC-barrel domain